MNEPENTFQDSSEVAELRQQVADLNSQTTRLFIGLVIVSLMFAAFVGLQARRAGKDVDLIRPRTIELVDLNKKQAPAIQNFLSQLGAYGQGHPDYAEKILAKYGIKPVSPAAVGATQPIAPKK
jgi:hypothetical protein